MPTRNVTQSRPPAQPSPPPRRARVPPLTSLAVSLVCGASLAGCISSSRPVATVAVSAAVPAAFSRERLVGKWGVASFHNEKDRKRTEAQARAQCSLPYVVAQGPSDGVMMHVADDAKLYELKLKGGAGGKTYLGFEAPAGDPQDREILSASDTMLTLRFVDADANRRYGTFVYVRCSR
jgi:hypothetical protein